jgi:hypothetical protein
VDISGLAKRYGPVGIPLILGLAFTLTGWTSDGVGVALLIFAAMWFAYLALWPRVKAQLAGAVAEELAVATASPSDLRELRIAVASISEELEHSRPVLDELDHDFFDAYKLPVHQWNQHGAALASHGHMRAHRVTREAYRKIDEVNRNLVYKQAGHQIWRTYIDEERARSALTAIDAALPELARIDVTH